MKRILGLDLGTNSIGWALINQDYDEESKKIIDGNIIDIGSRIIPMSQDILGVFDSGQSYSQTAERTGYRGVRRLRERNLLRRERLHRVLHILDFLPKHYSNQIDFDKHFGKFIDESEPKLVYKHNIETDKFEFLFQGSFTEMLADFAKYQPELVKDDKKIPFDWTIYYLRKKALTRKIEKEELAWLLLHFNQKRGYYQLRGEDEEQNDNKLVEFHSLQVKDVVDMQEQNAKKQQLYKIILENGWEFVKPSSTPIEWKNKTKDFIVSTDLDDDGKVKTDKYGKEKRTFRAPDENDWTLLKKKTEFDIEKSKKSVGAYIYDTLLENPNQKIKGKLVRTIERKFYKEELEQILNTQKEFHKELQDEKLYTLCLEELYEHNEAHRSNITKKDFTHLFLNDIIFYQRPLKSKKSLISNCKYESRTFIKDGIKTTEPLKCIAKSHPLFQEFRLLQFIHNLRIYKKDTTEIDITNEFLNTEQDWINLFNFLNTKKEIEQKNLLKHFGKTITIDKYRWNYVEDKIYPCNETRAQILYKLNKVETISDDFLTEEKEEELWHILYSVEDKIEIEKAIKTFASKNNLSDDFVENFKKFPPYKKEYGSYSAKAIKKLLPLMRFGNYWNANKIDIKTKDRIEKIITAEYDETIKNRVREKAINLKTIEDFKALPLWLTSYIVYDRHSEDSSIKKWKISSDIELLQQHSLRNPIVEQVINETLQVVKNIWNAYGNGEENFFDEIHIELGREMKNPADKRKQMTNQISENENSNIRIKTLLTELLNDKDVLNVRPYSPSQQEILKIYEDGILKSDIEIPDDILKISKMAQPTKSELTKYKLWLEQKYRSPYTGEIIPLNKLFTTAYEIEHVIPQSRYFDDSFSNKVICESVVNKLKDNQLGFEFIKNNQGEIIESNFGKKLKIFTETEYQDFIKRQYSNNRSKMKKLLMDEIPQSFIERQMNDSRYINKVVKNLLSNIVRESNEQETTSKNVIPSNGNITNTLKQDWGLNDVWNDIITPRFIRLNELTNSTNFGEWTNKDGKKIFQTQIPLELSKGFSKKRIDHRHHALDALIIACASRNHINYLNNQNALEKDKSQQSRHDLKQTLCYKHKTDENGNYKWIFYKPWNKFTEQAKEKLQTTIISFKQNLRVINNTTNYYETWKKDAAGILKKVKEKQTKGDSWAIRKPMHKETVSGQVNLRLIKSVSLSIALENWKMIINKELKMHIKDLVSHNYDKPMLQKYFKDRKNTWNNLDVSKIDIYYFDDDYVASRVKLDDSFSASKIASITDTGIQKILLNHLENYKGNLDDKGKEIAPETLAFTPDGIDTLNKNITELNNGKPHQPILKVRTYESKGNKFNVGIKGNKKDKFVEAAKGTNLFFGIYKDESGKRNYETIPLNIIIERQKQGLSSVPETNEKGNQLSFHLSPNDLVYIPTKEEQENSNSINFQDLSNEQINRVYKMVSSSGTQCFFIRNNIAISIVNKMEFSALNKMEKSIDGIMIKEFCWKLKIDRLGKITKVIR